MTILTITGTIDFAELWPGKKSDADTMHMDVKPGAFRVQKSPRGPSKVTRVFDSATMKLPGKMQPIIAKGDGAGTGTITIRLEGIDAPELHILPKALPPGATPAQRALFAEANHDYRQFWAETSVKRLRKILGPLEDKAAPCRVVTKLLPPDDGPNAVCDVFTRVVGEIEIRRGGKWISINREMVRAGAVFPAFYNSMDPADLRAFLALTARGRKQAGSIWPNLAATIPAFIPGMRFEAGDATYTEAGDRAGSVLFPKLFRRQANWFAHEHAGFVNGDFPQFIQNHTSADVCHRTTDFLASGHAAARLKFSTFISPKGRVNFAPEDLVFLEMPSTLFDAAGKPVTAW